MFEMFLLISVKLTSDLEFLCYLRKTTLNCTIDCRSSENHFLLGQERDFSTCTLIGWSRK